MCREGTKESRDAKKLHSPGIAREGFTKAQTSGMGGKRQSRVAERKNGGGLLSMSHNEKFSEERDHPGTPHHLEKKIHCSKSREVLREGDQRAENSILAKKSGKKKGVIVPSPREKEKFLQKEKEKKGVSFLCLKKRETLAKGAKGLLSSTRRRDGT